MKFNKSIRLTGNGGLLVEKYFIELEHYKEIEHFSQMIIKVCNALAGKEENKDLIAYMSILKSAIHSC